MSETTNDMSWQDVAAMADIPPLGGRILRLAGRGIALLRNIEGGRVRLRWSP